MERMLSQVDPNSDDSSSSGNVSLLCVEVPAAETDRYGFILGTGSTVGAEGPPPEVVRQRETKWLNIISQWDRILLKKTNKVKEQCRKGIPASLRARCWPLLCRATERMSKKKRLYQDLDSSPALQSWVDVIERDIDRQFPFHEMFLSRDGYGQQGLFRILKAYTQFRPDEGYCQGQGPVAAVLLMNMPAEDAFWCLVQISEQYLPGYYSPLLEGVLFDAGMLSGVLRKMCPSAYRHLQKHGVEPLMFATDWLMCLYTRHLPFNALLRVWDLFFCYGVRVLFQVAVVLVRRALGRQDQREECKGQMETLERLRGIKAQVPQEDDSFIEEVCSVPFSGRDLERETERELERWRKERPSSAFDPRQRCNGYRAAWVKGREREDQQERVEKERGNLSLPLLRSPSSLSPSILRKRWKRGSRLETGERERARKGEQEGEKQAGGKAEEAVEVEKCDKGRERERCWRSDREGEVQRNTEAHRAPLEYPNMSVAGNPVQTMDRSPHSTTEPHGTSTILNHGLTSEQEPQVRGDGPTERGNAHAKPIPDTVVQPRLVTQLVVSTETNQEFGNAEGSAVLSQTHTHFPERSGGSLEPGPTSRTSTAGQRSAIETANADPLDCGKTVEKSPGRNLEQKDHIGLRKETAERLGGTDKLPIGSAPEDARDCSTNTNASNQKLGNQKPQESNQPALYNPREVEPSEQLLVNHDGALGNAPQDKQDSSRHSGGEFLEWLEDSGTVGLQGGHSSDTSQTGLPANHSPTGYPTCPLTGKRGSPQGESKKGNQPSPSLLVESPKKEQTPNDRTMAGWEGADQSFSPPGCEGSTGTPGLNQGEESPTPHQIEGSPEFHQVEGLPVAPILHQGEWSPLLDQGEGSPVLDQREESPVLYQGEGLPVVDQGEGSSVLDQGEESPVLDLGEGSPIVTRNEGSGVLDQDEGLLVVPVLDLGEQSPTDQIEVRPVLDQVAPVDEVEGLPALLGLGQVEMLPVTSVLDQVEELPVTPLFDHAEVLPVKPVLDQVGGLSIIPVFDEVEESPVIPVLAQVEESGSQQSVASDPQLPTSALSITEVVSFSSSHSQDSTAGPMSETLPIVTGDVSVQLPHLPDNAEQTKWAGDAHQEEAQHTKTDPPPPAGGPCTSAEKSSEVYRPRRVPSSKAFHFRTLSEDIFRDPSHAGSETNLANGPSGHSPQYISKPYDPSHKSKPSLSTDPCLYDKTKSRTPYDPSYQDKTKSCLSSDLSQQDMSSPLPASNQVDAPCRFALFRMLRGDRPKDRRGGDGSGKDKTSTPKMKVPTILIQDFSDAVGPGGDGLSSKERRRRRREQERREREEEKARKEREKEIQKEKDSERKKPQTRGKSFHVHSAKCDVPPPRNNSFKIPGSKRNSAPFFDTYF